jgi:hypothetical protein
MVVRGGLFPRLPRLPSSSQDKCEKAEKIMLEILLNRHGVVN